MQHYQIEVKGKVQGVFFRKSTQQKAHLLGIRGWVCNQPDGSVYVEASAEEEALVQFLDWLKKGPRLARVDSVSAQPFSPKDIKDGFSIRY